jgi:hypothetical protein
MNLHLQQAACTLDHVYFRPPKRLSNDIRKSVHHIFGQHQHCSDFCRAKIQPPQHTQTDSTSCMSSCQPGIEETDLIEEQVDTLYLHQILLLYASNFLQGL